MEEEEFRRKIVCNNIRSCIVLIGYVCTENRQLKIFALLWSGKTQKSVQKIIFSRDEIM